MRRLILLAVLLIAAPALAGAPEVVSFKYQKTAQTETHHQFSWVVEVFNPNDIMKEVAVTVEFLDARGFIIAEDTEKIFLWVETGNPATVKGRKLVPMPEAATITDAVPKAKITANPLNSIRH